MKPIYPVSLKQMHPWLLKTAEMLANQTEIEEIADVYELDDIEIITNIQEYPKAFVVIKLPSQVVYSFIEPEILQSILEVPSLRHIPVLMYETFRLFDSNGDDITSLYFNRRLLYRLEETTYDVIAEMNLALVTAKLQKDDLEPVPRQHYDLIVDDEEILMYRVTSPFRTCRRVRNHIEFMAPGSPSVIMTGLQNRQFELRYNLKTSKVFRGSIVKIDMQLLPFPHFIFTIGEGECDGIELEDVELPSYYLFDWEPEEAEGFFEIGKASVLKRISWLKAQQKLKTTPI
jgi:hypothetical protein